jgi:hypothetical protein
MLIFTYLQLLFPCSSCTDMLCTYEVFLLFMVLCLFFEGSTVHNNMTLLPITESDNSGGIK